MKNWLAKYRTSLTFFAMGTVSLQIVQFSGCASHFEFFLVICVFSHISFFPCNWNGQFCTTAFEIFKTLLHKEEFLFIGLPFRFFSYTWDLSIPFFFKHFKTRVLWCYSRLYHLALYKFWKYITNLIEAASVESDLTFPLQ